MSLHDRKMNSTLESLTNDVSKEDVSINEMGNLQVGGISNNKRPMLTLQPHYVLKPIREDERGFREVAFYESIRMGDKLIALDLDGVFQCRDLHTHGSYPSIKQNILASSKLDTKYFEVNHQLRRLSKVTASYYGLVVVDKYLYILLSDATTNFHRPSVMDVKIGKQTFEPSALPQKVEREMTKYVQQEQFGFRIVGMRVHDSSHPDANSLGFRIFDKKFGRSLNTISKIKSAIAIFFGYKVVRLQNQPSIFKEISQSTTLKRPIILNNDKQRNSSVSKVISHLKHIRKWFQDN